MELISHGDFHKLRLVDFAPDPGEVVELADWEFMDRLWVGEAVGFSEWLRYQDRPSRLGCLSLDLAHFAEENAQRIFDALHLPLRYGMSYESVVGVLGAPSGERVFVRCRKTYEFICGERWKYVVGCTVLDEGGLSYVTVSADGGGAAV